MSVKKRLFKRLPPLVVQESLLYDPETGLLRWKRRPEHHFTSELGHAGSRRREGTIAGGNTGHGYISVHFQYMGAAYRLLAHRIAFCLQTGKWPLGQIDHIDGNRSNNAWSNLREASHQENIRNSRTRRDNHLGIKWVRKSRGCNRYEARATVNGKSYYFGAFGTPEEAQAAAIERLKVIHGEFFNAGV